MSTKDLDTIAILGLGLLGGSLAMAVRSHMPKIRLVGFAHRPSTRRKARAAGLVDLATGQVCQAVSDAQLVVLATPVCIFEVLFQQMARALRPGTVVTDVGSTKVQVHQWAELHLPKSVQFVGSHPMAGSEQRGLEAARPDLFLGATCFITRGRRTKGHKVMIVKQLWQGLGCNVLELSPSVHDRIVAAISHVPQAAAVALVNATSQQYIQFAAKGFRDTTRIASGPASVWTDIFLTNHKNIALGIGRVIRQLDLLRRAIAAQDRIRIERILNSARQRRQPIASFTSPRATSRR